MGVHPGECISSILPVPHNLDSNLMDVWQQQQQQQNNIVAAPTGSRIPGASQGLSPSLGADMGNGIENNQE